MPKPSPDDTYSPEETEKRREAALKYAFTMPPKSQKEVKESKGKA